jgi:hypothetical protein
VSNLASLGIFFAGFFGGFGVFLLGCGLMWFISVWSKKK